MDPPVRGIYLYIAKKGGGRIGRYDGASWCGFGVNINKK